MMESLVTEDFPISGKATSYTLPQTSMPLLPSHLQSKAYIHITLHKRGLEMLGIVDLLTNKDTMISKVHIKFMNPINSSLLHLHKQIYIRIKKLRFVNQHCLNKAI